MDLDKNFDNKFSLIDKDSINVDFEIIEDHFNSNLEIALNLEQSQRYSLRLLPGALIDLFGEQNDTLNFSFRNLMLIKFAFFLRVG